MEKLTREQIKNKAAIILNEHPSNIKTINVVLGGDKYIIGVSRMVAKTKQKVVEEMTARTITLQQLEDCDIGVD